MCPKIAGFEAPHGKNGKLAKGRTEVEDYVALGEKRQLKLNLRNLYHQDR
jgi:hypothetical protein